MKSKPLKPWRKKGWKPRVGDKVSLWDFSREPYPPVFAVIVGIENPEQWTKGRILVAVRRQYPISGDEWEPRTVMAGTLRSPIEVANREFSEQTEAIRVERAARDAGDARARAWDLDMTRVGKELLDKFESAGFRPSLVSAGGKHVDGPWFSGPTIRFDLNEAQRMLDVLERLQEQAKK